MSTRLRLALLAVLLGGPRCQLPEAGSADAATDVAGDVVEDVIDGAADADDASDAGLDNDATPDAGFSPLDVSGLALWLRADLGTTLQNGVSIWADSSGSQDPNKDLTQISTGAQPTYNSADPSYNGHATVAFSKSASQTLASGTWLVPVKQPLTIFVVANFDGSASTQMLALSKGNGFIELFCNDGKPGAGIYAGSFLYGNAGPSGQPQVYGAVFAGTSSAVFQSALTPTGTGSVFPDYLVTDLTLGTIANSAFLNGKIAEVTVYAGIVAGNDLTALMSYFGTRYGIPIGP